MIDYCGECKLPFPTHLLSCSKAAQPAAETGDALREQIIRLQIEERKRSLDKSLHPDDRWLASGKDIAFSKVLDLLYTEAALAAATPAVAGVPLSPRKMAHLNTIWEPWTDKDGNPLVCGICHNEIPQCEQGWHGDGVNVFHECCSYQKQIADLKAAAVPADEKLRERIDKLPRYIFSPTADCYCEKCANGGWVVLEDVRAALALREREGEK